MAVEIKHCK
uniref:Uncharacterized protein n=1 Tax=Anguilla anguilla TaxID=7936 RepID=A0A0E9XZ23_ANGAN